MDYAQRFRLRCMHEKATTFNNNFADLLCKLNAQFAALKCIRWPTKFWVIVKVSDVQMGNFLYARLVGTYNGMARASVRLSVCGSVRKACKHDRDWTVPARAVKLGIHTTYDKRTNPIDFQGQGSKVKVTRWTLLLNLVNTIQTEPFEVGLSNLVHILLMTRGRTLLIFKVRGQRSRSHVTHSC